MAATDAGMLFVFLLSWKGRASLRPLGPAAARTMLPATATAASRRTSVLQNVAFGKLSDGFALLAFVLAFPIALMRH